MYQRLNIYLIGGALLAAYVIANISDDSYIKERYRALNFNADIKAQYESKRETYDYRGLKMPSFEKYYSEQLPRYTKAFLLIGIFTLITLIPWLIFITWRQAAPICFDRKRQLVYTWHKGKLYAAKLDQLQIELKDKSTHLEFSGGWGPVIITLYPAGEVYDASKNLKKGKRIAIGTFIPQYNYQNHDLKPFIENYMAGYLNIPSDIEPSKSWLEYAPRKPKELPSDEILSKAIDEWFKQEKAIK